MHPNTPAHIVYKEPLVPGDIISIPVQQSQDGRPSDLKPPPWLIIYTIMTSYGPVNRIAPGLDPRNVSVQAGDIVIVEPAKLRDCGISVPVLFRPTVDVYASAASSMFSGEMFIGHLAPEFGPQLAAAREALADRRQKRARHLARTKHR